MVSAGPRLIVSVFSAFGLSDRISVRRALSPPTQDGFSRPLPYRLCILPSASQTGSAPSAWSVSKPRPPNGSDVSFLVISPSRPYSVSCGRPPDETPHLPDSFGPCSIARPDELTAPLAGCGAVSGEPGPGRSLLACALPLHGVDPGDAYLSLRLFLNYYSWHLFLPIRLARLVHG